MLTSGIYGAFSPLKTTMQREAEAAEKAQNPGPSYGVDRVVLSTEGVQKASGLTAVFSAVDEPTNADAIKAGLKGLDETGDDNSLAAKTTQNIKEQIEKLKKEIEKIEQEIKKLQQEEQTDERDQKISAKQSQISILRSQIQELTKELNGGSSTTGGGTRAQSASEIASAQVYA